MITQNKKVENTYSMKKALVLLVSFICYQIVCHAQVMDEHYYQNFLIFLFDILNILKFSIFFI